jgi:diguanylate cyclase (GGDEF)-like protein/PAS domain S-box-containing protein
MHDRLEWTSRLQRGIEMIPELPKRILYLEDNPADAYMIRHVLAQQAPEITLEIAGTLRAGLECLAPEAPGYDLILSDLRLPDGSGLDLLGQVRERGLPIAVVILTGSGDQISAIAALKAGADDYLSKRDGYCDRLIHTLSAALARFRLNSAGKCRVLRVLYAEHIEFDIDLTRRHFAQHARQLRLKVVNSGEEVLAMLPVDATIVPPYDVILLDYQLPGMNALEIVKILNDERGIGLPIVLVTGQGSEDMVSEGLRLGVSDYVVKQPGYLAELPVVLERAYQQARLLREQDTVRTTTARLQQLLAASPTILYALKVEGERLVLVWVSENVTHLLGFGTEECLQPGWWRDHLHPEDREQVLSAYRNILTEHSAPREYRIHDKTGNVHWMRDDMRLVSDTDGRPSEIVGSWSDITAEHRAYERLMLHAAALDSTRDAIIITDLQARILAVNPAFTEITGYTEEEVWGNDPRLLQSSRHDRAFFQSIWTSLRQSGQWQGEIWNRRKNGESFPQLVTLSTVRDTRGEPTHYVAVMTDLTSMKQSEERLEFLAHYDPLTGLPNRLLLRSLLQHALEKVQDRQVGVLFLNLDQFKTINDSLGHSSGDQVLLGVASRITELLDGKHILGRLSADEFVVVMESLEETLDAESIACNLLLALDRPFELQDGHEVYARASIGISVFPQDGSTAQDLLHRADAAMHRAKENGGNQFAFYTSELSVRALSRLEMETALRRALGAREFVLYYQPKVNLVSGKITGAEALLRWARPDLGMVPPLEFIPLAERTGLIVGIGAWVINEACRQIRAWADAGLTDVMVAVNVSARQFSGGGLEAVVQSALQRNGVAPRCLCLELTESMLMAEPEQAIGRLGALKLIGVRLSLDDFGTGYSSLAYLGRFPVDELKIDRSFVKNIVSDPSAANIANSVIAMAHLMQLKVVAEGVETEAQLGYLRKNRCEEMQGYYFSKPVPAEEFAAMLRQDKSIPVESDIAELRTLLIVDDQASILAALEHTLQGQGYRILTARSARAGLELLASNSVHVILSDQLMPEMSGTEFLGRVRRLHPHAVRIVISGYTEIESVLQAVNQGSLYKFLTKPWDDLQLRENIREAFRYYDAMVRSPEGDSA